MTSSTSNDAATDAETAKLELVGSLERVDSMAPSLEDTNRIVGAINVAASVSPEMKKIFESEPLTNVLASDNYNIAQMPCIRFWPNLFAIFLPYELAMQLLTDVSMQTEMHRWAERISSKKDAGAELAFIIYAPFRTGTREERRAQDKIPFAIIGANVAIKKFVIISEAILKATDITIPIDKEHDGDFFGMAKIAKKNTASFVKMINEATIRIERQLEEDIAHAESSRHELEKILEEIQLKQESVANKLRLAD